MVLNVMCYFFEIRCIVAIIATVKQTNENNLGAAASHVVWQPPS